MVNYLQKLYSNGFGFILKTNIDIVIVQTGAQVVRR